jgi:cyclophilin family peptidyl-prolyl cis-trans isomerase
MSRPPTQRDRERARRRARDEALEREARAARSRRRTLGVVGLVVLLALVAGVAGAVTGGGGQSSSPTTTAPASTTTTLPFSSDVVLPKAPPGATIDGPTPCPADDGSSPRTTTFSGPPPTCIDSTRFYEAVITTTKGPITLQLNPETAPGAVNNFVVLARYGYYDGQPVTAVVPRAAMVFEGSFDNPEGVESPGYTIPDEFREEGQIFTPGVIAMIPRNGEPDSIGGAFLIATFEDSAGLPQNLTQFGIMLDGAPTLAAVNRIGTESGAPSEVVTIESITVTESIPIS